MRNFSHIVVCCLFVASLTGSCGTANRVESSPSDELVDIGYESTRKGDLSYSVASMKPEDTETRTSPAPQEATSSATNEPGAGTTVEPDAVHIPQRASDTADDKAGEAGNNED